MSLKVFSFFSKTAPGREERQRWALNEIKKTQAQQPQRAAQAGWFTREECLIHPLANMQKTYILKIERISWFTLYIQIVFLQNCFFSLPDGICICMSTCKPTYRKKTRWQILQVCFASFQDVLDFQSNNFNGIGGDSHIPSGKLT